MSYSRISDLNGSKENWLIQARLCRLWEAVDFKSNNEVFGLEMVFVDEQVSFTIPLYSSLGIVYNHFYKNLRSFIRTLKKTWVYLTHNLIEVVFTNA